MPDIIERLSEKPAALFDNALSSLTKKAASSFFQKFKRFLSTASEPFFRQDMGERYLSGDALFGGAAIWAIATIIALWQPVLRSPIPIVCEAMMWFKLARLFHFCQYWMLTFAAGGLLVFFHMKFGLQSAILMAKYRAEGTPYHTQSRGIPRWGGNEVWVGLAIGAVLLAFDLPAGILFAISCAMSAKLASEQQAAIYARYLDALDQKVEQEYLEDAILGKCPTEITQLNKPLPSNLNSDLRNNIAAAAVGKPVQIVAKAPRRAGARTGPPDPPAPLPPAPALARTPDSAETEYTTQTESPRQGAKMPASNFISNRKLRVVAIAVSATALTAWAAVSLLPSHRQASAAVAARPQSVQAVQPRIEPTSAAQVAQNQGRASPAPVTPATQLKRAAEISNSAALAQAALEAERRQEEEKAKAQAALEAQKRQEQERLAALEQQKREERTKIIDQIDTTLTNQVARLSKFKADCQTRLDNNTNKLAKVASSSKKTLTKTNNEFREQIAKNVQGQETSLDNVQKDMQAVSSNPQLDPRPLSDQLTGFITSMDKDHETITRLLNELDVAISNAPKKRGLFDFNIK